YSPLSTVSGDAVHLLATVSFAKIKDAPMSGTVTFSATNIHHTSVTLTCKTGDPATVNKDGRAQCDLTAPTFFASGGPYVIAASYSGSSDGNFDKSTGTTTITPAVASTKISLKLSPKKPNSSSGETVTADVKAGPGTAGLYGDVVFVITSSNGRKADLVCSNSTLPKRETVPLTGHEAVCDIPTGWLKVPSATSSTKHPFDAWTIVAQFDGNADYSAPQIAAHKQGKDFD
ncbi:MAG TPA: hypothetical protein VEJ87_15050, partial [Acidimicrobiales bacterium]|nr:hypothetical protein [Acidimicrobiales bacterium]